MLCPACNHDNIPGEDLCAECGMDLVGLDVPARDISADDPLLARPLGELPLKKPLLLPLDATVAAAVELMQERHEGCVFLLETGRRLAGVFTERDVALRVVTRGRDPQTTLLREVMTPNPFALRHDDSLAFALHRMGVDGFRHIPVLNGERIVGFLSIRTVLRVLAQEAKAQ
jgi:CBS domain-containing protein